VAAGLAEMSRVMKANLAAGKAWEGGLYQSVDLRPLLGRIRCPTLIVAGELDLSAALPRPSRSPAQSPELSSSCWPAADIYPASKPPRNTVTRLRNSSTTDRRGNYPSLQPTRICREPAPVLPLRQWLITTSGHAAMISTNVLACDIVLCRWWLHGRTALTALWDSDAVGAG
jgi:pimeloyl-ACP methyl ester carboxylesterase